MTAILNELNSQFDIHPEAEITMEANPGTVTSEALIQYKRAGVNGSVWDFSRLTIKNLAILAEYTPMMSF